MNKSPIIGAWAVDINNRSFSLGRIKGLTTGRDGETRAVFEESKTPWLKKIFGLGKSKTIALRGLHILNDVHVKTTIVPRNLVRFSKSRDESTMIRFRNKDLSVFLVSLEELQIEEVVVWNPNRSLNPEDSFIGDIKQTAVHIDVTNVQTFYAELSMTNGFERLLNGNYGARLQKSGTLECRVWVPVTELKKIGEVIRNSANDSGFGPEITGHAEQHSVTTNSPPPECSKNVVSSNLRLESPTPMETDLDEDENRPPSGIKKYFLKNLSKAGNKNILDKGIQGQSNSCYIDASIFCLFSFTTTFDSVLLQSSSTTKNAAIKESLARIVAKLRTDFFVPSSDVHSLRIAMNQINERYSAGCFMDAEELLLDIFDCLDCPDFFEFTNQATDRIHQIVLPASDEFGGFSNDNIYAKDIALLFKDSLWYSDVKLAKIPHPALILKLPFCNGRPLFGCKIVVPNLKLDLEPMTEKKEIYPQPMELFAIMCLKSSHYVCYVKCGNEEFSPWIYFDSSPVDMTPKMQVLPTLSHDLVKVIQDPGILKQVDSANTLEFRDHVNLICNYCYMCFYK